MTDYLRRNYYEEVSIRQRTLNNALLVIIAIAVVVTATVTCIEFVMLVHAIQSIQQSFTGLGGIK